MASIHTARKAHGKANSEFFLPYSWAKYELEKGYEDYLTKGKVIHCFCHKKTGHNELFDELIELQQEKGFDLILSYYKNDDTPDYVVERIHADGQRVEEIIEGNEFDIARLDPFDAIEADLCIGNPEAHVFEQHFNVISQCYPNYVLWGHNHKILCDDVRMASMRGEVWGGNTHNKTIPFIDWEGNADSKGKGGWSVYTNCNVHICKRKFITPKKSIEEVMKSGKMYLYDNSTSLYNVDDTRNIPRDYKGKLAIPVSGLFYLNPLFVKHLGNINNKKINEEIGQFGFNKVLAKKKNGGLQEVTLGVKNGKICASRVVIELI